MEMVWTIGVGKWKIENARILIGISIEHLIVGLTWAQFRVLREPKIPMMAILMYAFKLILS